MKLKFLLGFAVAFVVGTTLASLNDGITVTDKTNPNEKNCFKRVKENSPVFLACTDKMVLPDEPAFGSEAGSTKYSFHVYAANDQEDIKKGADLGYICMYLSKTCLNISHVEIDQLYRRKGFGTAALETILGIYRAKKREHLSFDHFCITTTAYNEAALHVYEKLGFKAEIRAGHPIPPEWVYLFLDRAATKPDS